MPRSLFPVSGLDLETSILRALPRLLPRRDRGGATLFQTLLVRLIRPDFLPGDGAYFPVPGLHADDLLFC